VLETLFYVEGMGVLYGNEEIVNDLVKFE